MSMLRYQCHKKVDAAKITRIECGRSDGKGPGQTLVCGRLRISVGEEYIHKHDPQEGGYYVLYDDGYESFSPAEAFESGYTRV